MDIEFKCVDTSSDFIVTDAIFDFNTTTINSAGCDNGFFIYLNESDKQSLIENLEIIYHFNVEIIVEHIGIDIILHSFSYMVNSDNIFIFGGELESK